MWKVLYSLTFRGRPCGEFPNHLAFTLSIVEALLLLETVMVENDTDSADRESTCLGKTEVI
ncbi:MAG: hypothetical protein SH808_13610 [Saprospiraceae bacterium]|nr:hypothetical protein [Saprospiraceae bacterium]